MCLLILFSVLHQSCANEKVNNTGTMGHWICLCTLPFILITEGGVCDPLDFFVLQFSYTFCPSTHSLIFQTCFKVFSFFSKACANTGVGIIHMTTGMHLAVTLPQAVHHPPSYLCVPESFLRMHLETETPCQLFASFSCPFLVLSLLPLSCTFVSRAPISAQIIVFLSN